MAQLRTQKRLGQSSSAEKSKFYNLFLQHCIRCEGWRVYAFSILTGMHII
jgi:hypothetical protein